MVVVLVAASCSRSTLVGSELLENEKADVQYTDSLRLHFKTVVDDSIQTFPANLERRQENFLVGMINDPVFGTSSSEIYTHLGLNFSTSPLNLLETEIDSVVLFMEYDTTAFYGMKNVPVSIEVRQMIEGMDVLEEYFADDVFEVDQGNPLGVLENHIPAPADSVLVSNPGDTSLRVPHMRISLDPGFLQDIIQDTVNLQNQDSLNAVFNGFRIKMTESANSMLSFNLKGYSGVSVYYRMDGETPSVYSFNFGFTTVTTMHQEHEYSGSIVESFLDDEEMGDSLFFIQSMVGLNTEMRIDDIFSVGDVLINHAKLVLYGVELDQDEAAFFPPIAQLVTLDINNDGDAIYSRDVALALSADLLVEIFGGNAGEPLEDNMRIRKYEMTVTSQMQDIFRSETDKLSISSFLKANAANRVVFLGPSSQAYAPKLKLTYTQAP